MEDGALCGLVSPDSYQAERKHVFPALQSLKWYIRNHKAGLVENGALVLVVKRHMIDKQAFDAYVVRAGRERAAERVAEAA